MSDYISREAAIGAIKELCEHYTPTKSVTHPHMDFVIEELQNLPSVQPEIIRCKDCKHFEYDHPYIIQGIPVLGHEVCNAWGDGCKTDEDGYCFMAERRTDERFNRQTGGD